jgi:lipopolysaccharide/colanic/teichoic acid biosynthesis glycosyltransferase
LTLLAVGSSPGGPSVALGAGTDSPALTRTQAVRKRVFDVLASAGGLVGLSWLIAIAYVAATIDTRASGFFRQERIGRDGRRFNVIKIRSMRADPGIDTSVTTARDPRITRLGRFFRRSKIDELPQLWNVLKGDMSLVGPRPEVPGFADLLTGADRAILSIRPGITGPATLHFRNEEELLAASDDPEAYNRDVIFPTKVRMNLEYLREYSFRGDLDLLRRTLW